MIKRFALLALSFLLLLAACSTPAEESAEPAAEEAAATQETAPAEEEPAAEPETTTLRVMSHDSFNISEETLAAFEAETGIAVEVFGAGDAGEALNKAILAKDAPLADMLYGVDNTFLSRALENDLFIPYDSPLLDKVDEQFKLAPNNEALPVDFGDVCLNYDVAWFAENGLEPPQTLDDLIDPAYANLTVVENPATSSPGLAFLLATIAQYGEDGYLAYWEQLNNNGLLVTNGWSEAYYGEFTAASEGSRPIVVSYASSPPAEVIFAETELTEAPTAAVVTDGSCFRQIEFVGILQGTENEAAAQQFIDYMLGVTFQEDIPMNMFVYPVNEDAQLPEQFATYSVLPENPATLDPAQITANREAWIEAWTETVLR